MHFFLRIIHLAYCRGLYRVEEFVFPRRPFFALITACFGGDEGEDELVVLSSSCTVARVVGGPALNFVFLLGLGALAVAVPSVVALDAAGVCNSSVLCSMWSTAVAVAAGNGSVFGLNSGLRGAPGTMFQPNLGVAGTGTPITFCGGGPDAVTVVSRCADAAE